MNGIGLVFREAFVQVAIGLILGNTWRRYSSESNVYQALQRKRSGSCCTLLGIGCACHWREYCEHIAGLSSLRELTLFVLCAWNKPCHVRVDHRDFVSDIAASS